MTPRRDARGRFLPSEPLAVVPPGRPTRGAAMHRLRVRPAVAGLYIGTGLAAAALGALAGWYV